MAPQGAFFYVQEVRYVARDTDVGSDARHGWRTCRKRTEQFLATQEVRYVARDMDVGDVENAGAFFDVVTRILKLSDPWQAKAHDCMDAGGRAKQEARAEADRCSLHYRHSRRPGR